MTDRKFSWYETAMYGTLVISYVACVVSLAAAAATYWWGMSPVSSFFLGTGSALAIAFAGSLIASVVLANNS